LQKNIGAFQINLELKKLLIERLIKSKNKIFLVDYICFDTVSVVLGSGGVCEKELQQPVTI
jgi:hypothetical protein